MNIESDVQRWCYMAFAISAVAIYAGWPRRGTRLGAEHESAAPRSGGRHHRDIHFELVRKLNDAPHFDWRNLPVQYDIRFGESDEEVDNDELRQEIRSKGAMSLSPHQAGNYSTSVVAMGD